jgi:pimeloyl-ACP methyl ester carboxylesterase
LANFEYKNTVINYSDIGQGSAIVLLHGFLENMSMWDFCIATLSKNNRIISIDLLGHGKTDCLGYVHTMEDQSDMIFTLLQNLKIKKATFIGHSMGGYVALAFAEQYPKNIDKLALLNSTSKADSAEKVNNRNRAIKAVKHNYSNFVRLSVGNLFSTDNQTRLANEIESVKLEALQTPLQGIIAALEGMKIRKDRETIFHDLKCSKLLILGEKDAVLDFEATKIQAENSDITLVPLSGGHMSHIENQEELLSILMRFV